MVDPSSSQPGWGFWIGSTSDWTLDMAAIRAKFLGIRLAQAMAERLDSVVPRPVVVAPEEGWVVVRDGDTEWQRLGIEPLLGQPGAAWEHVGVAVWSALNHVQDFVIETFKRPWPLPDATDPSTSRGADLPLPGVRVEADSIRLWYGDDDQPTLELPAILRRDLLSPS